MGAEPELLWRPRGPDTLILGTSQPLQTTVPRPTDGKSEQGECRQTREVEEMSKRKGGTRGWW